MANTLDTGTIIDDSHNAVFFKSAAEAEAEGDDCTKKEIAIHWWGRTAGGTLMTDFDTVIATFCDGGKETSAHFIVEAGRAACVVSPDDVAYAVGDWAGNLRSISIECNPRGWNTDYNEIAAMIRYIRGIYGDLPLKPHNSYVATECPGTYDLTRLDALARNIQHDGSTAMADVTTPVDRFDDYGKPDGTQTSVIKEAQWNKANKDAIIAAVNAAKDEVLNAIKAEIAQDKS